MRLPTMTTKNTSFQLLFTLLFTVIASFQLSAQIDQDGGDLNAGGESVPCNNLDLTLMDADVESLMLNYPFSDTDGDICADMMPMYVAGSVIITDDSPYTCGDQIEVEYEVMCDGGTIHSGIISMIDVVDATNPFEANPPPQPVETCDFASAYATFTAWVADIEDPNNGYFDDNCSDAALLVITNQGIPGSFDFTACMDQVIMVDFEVLDECGNAEIFTYSWEIADDGNGPDVSGAQDPTPSECGAGVDPQADFDTWVADVEANAFGDVGDDDCHGPNGITIVCTSCPHTVVVSGCGWMEDIDFQATDPCGNPSDFTLTYEITDNLDPSSLGISDNTVPCDAATNEADYLAWANSIASDPASYFTDDCTDDTQLVVTFDPPTISPDYTNCGDFTTTVTFTAVDLCGNSVDATAVFEITDNDPPVAVDWSNSGTPYGCNDDAAIAAEVEAILMNGTEDACSGPPSDFGDFSISPDLDDPASWTLSGDPCNGTYDFTVDYPDACGNILNGTVSIPVMDQTGPTITMVGPDVFDPSEMMSPYIVPIDCGNIPDPAWEITVEDDCAGVLVFSPDNITPGDCNNNEIWEYLLEDNCGNQIPFVIEWDISSTTAMTSLVDIDCSPGVILTQGDCDNLGGVFCAGTGAVWVEDATNPDGDLGCAFPAFPFPGVMFEGGCPPYEFAVNPPYAPDPLTVTTANGEVLELECPPIPYQGTVVWTVGDACGDVLEWEFTLDYQCVNCPPSTGCAGGNFLQSCTHCESATPEPSTPCYSCDATVLDGFCSCTPPGSSAIDNSQFNNPLCDDGFVPNNMSWFAFTAGSTEIDVLVTDVECLGGSIGVQTGIYAECEIGECLASDNNCGSNDDKSFGLSDLTVGNTYFIYVDGCAGAACNFLIEVSGVAPFELDEPLAITAMTLCDGQLGDPCEPDNVETICPGQEVTFVAHHDGSSPTDSGEFDDECSTYDPDLEVIYFWSFTPAIDGQSDLELIGPDDEFPPMVLTEPGTYEVCLEGVNHQCDDTAERACMQLVVDPLPAEEATFRVCRRDLAVGWDPGNEGDWKPQPGTSGQFEWQGGPITLAGIGDQLVAADGTTFSSGDCYTYQAMNDCGCIFDQTICIEILGTSCEEAEVVEMFMFDCQFYVFDNDEKGDKDYEPYCWVWDEFNNIESDPKLDIGMQGFDCVTVPMSSNVFNSWGTGEFCDTILKPDIRIMHIDSVLTSDPCTPQGTPWTFDLCTQVNDGNGDCTWDSDWPDVSVGNITFVDCNTGNFIAQGPTYTATSDITVCVKAEYSFNDGAFGGDNPIDFPVPTECSWIYGPMELTSQTVTPLELDGPPEHCATDNTGHTYTITNPVVGETYMWTGPAGTVFTPATGTSVMVDFPAGQSSVTITAAATAAGGCGTSPGSFTVNFTDSPVVNISPIGDVCLGEDITATANTTGGTAPYTYTWTPGAANMNAVTYTTSTAGAGQMVSVEVEDANGCKSLVAEQTYNVGEPLEAPVIECVAVIPTDSNVGFSWNAITGADGYIVTENGAAQPMQQNTDYTVSGLGLNTSVTITVEVVDPGPCPNPVSSPQTCTTTDCPIPAFEVDASPAPWCAEAPPAAVEFTWTEDPNNPGTISFDDGQGGTIVDAAGNVVDPVGLAPGTYTINTLYTYQNGDCTWPGPNVSLTVNPTPVADFEISSSICIDEMAALTDNTSGGTAVYDFGDPDVNQGNLSWNAAGDYTISVTVTSADGCEASSTQMITILDTLSPIFFNACETDINYIAFDWDDVDGASGYTYDWTSSMGNSGNGTTADSELRIEPLMQNEEVTLVVTATNGAGFCRPITGSETCTAGACDPIQAPRPMCDMEGDDQVSFVWDEVNDADGNPITEYIVLYDGQEIPVTSANGMGGFTADGLCPNEDSRIQVISVNPDPLCPNSNPSQPSDQCITGPCPDLMINCGSVPAGSTDQVRFEWNAVPGAEEYIVSYSINGDPFVDAGSTTDTFLELDGTDGLNPGDVVSIIVQLKLENCPPCNPSPGPTCPVGDCPDPVFVDPMLVACFTGDALQLSLPEVVDGTTGAVLPGTITWDPAEITDDVDRDSGEFIPADTEQSMSYSIEFEWVDDFTQCVYREFITIEVNIEPVAEINPIDDICEGSTVAISAVEVADDAAVYSWDFGDGVSASTDGPGPHDVTFNSATDNSTVTLTISSAAGCESTTTETVGIDAMLEPLNIDCGDFSNTSMEWVWNDIDGVSVYNVVIVETSTGDVIEDRNVFSTDVEVTGLTAGTEYTITVTAENPNSLCDPVTSSQTCIPSSCPKIAFDETAQYAYGPYCPGELADLSIQFGGAELLTSTPLEAIASQEWTAEAPNEGSVDAMGNFTGAGITGATTITVDYRVVYEGDNCAYDTTFIIEVVDGPFISDVVPNVPDCILDEVPEFEIFAAGGTEPYTFQISNLPEIDDMTTSAVYTVSAPGEYNVLVTDANGCTHETSVTVRPPDNPIAEINGPAVLFNEETGEFTVTVTGTDEPITNIEWFVNDSLLVTEPDQDVVEIIAQLSELGAGFDISVVVYFGPDCFITAEQREEIIDTEKIYIPNVISTVASDTDNGRWRMYTKGQVIVNSYSIYDRWGELVYTRDLDPSVDAVRLARPDTATEWNLDWTGEWGVPEGQSGTGDAVEPGVYVYVINLTYDKTDEDEGRTEVEAGDLTVFR